MMIRSWWALPVVVLALVGPPAPVVSRPPATSTVSSPAGTFPACVTAAVETMSLEEQVGQTLMVGVPLHSPQGIGGLVAGYHLGGVFLSGRSTRSSAGLRADITALQRTAKVPLLVSVDQEGGSVQALQGTDFPDIPAATTLGAGPPDELRRTVRDSADRLAGIGVTVNLAPVADTVPSGTDDRNPPIGAFRRQYDSDPIKVAEDIRTVVAASQGAGVLTILKHFPGLGRVRANTDTSTRAVDRTATVDDPYLDPFRAGMRQDSAGVMISLATYPRIDPASIAAFSRPIVTGLLRERYAFTGLIMSDDLGAADAVESVPTGDRAVRFLDAGGDLALTIRPQNVGPMVAALLAAARTSPVFAARVTDAASHVLAAKHRAGLLRC
ncbi:glycoside hydrolase family 3 N-terminal domain-containing protein [Actinoplanes friuliensis]|uniref:beta-N-acetylhexosaminidase n=1 Tax=Actinoplanes friuliensis DSM 7358 TaxID=1246995 RepID=U5W6Z9_9ACTN|nr:glycoside hydrolase family 3 N-terminal domain-containing protein [Actinoplanes friuliensis]AGZ43760.1 Beta-N-acetylhexosaminidase [Actinoplanes friuliensis DSM 7358]